MPLRAKLKVRAPAWPEKTSKFILSEMEKSSARFNESCRFCNLKEEPIVERVVQAPSFRVLESRFPYLPEHVASLHQLPPDGYKALGKAVKAVFGAMTKREGYALSASGNTGLIAGQTIPHLHIHLFPNVVKAEESLVYPDSTLTPPGPAVE